MNESLEVLSTKNETFYKSQNTTPLSKDWPDVEVFENWIMIYCIKTYWNCKKEIGIYVRPLSEYAFILGMKVLKMLLMPMKISLELTANG